MCGDVGEALGHAGCGGLRGHPAARCVCEVSDAGWAPRSSAGPAGPSHVTDRGGRPGPRTAATVKRGDRTNRAEHRPAVLTHRGEPSTNCGHAPSSELRILARRRDI